MYAGLLISFLVWMIYRSSRLELYAFGLLPIALSCFLLAVSPGHDDHSDRHDLALGRYGVRIGPAQGRAINAAFGLALLAAAYWCVR